MTISYTTQNESGEPVWIEANLDLEAEAEDAVWMLWAFAPLKRAVDGGDCDDEEKAALRRTVDALSDALELGNGAVYAGTRIQDGWAEVYFYAAWSKGAEKVFRDRFRDAGYPQIEYGANRDTQRHFYHASLYPDAYAFQQAKSREIIEELQAAGDDLSLVRPVEHYLFFQTPTSMRRAAERLREEGERVETDVEGEGAYPHGLMLQREHACTLEALDAVTRPLIDAAEREHGTYVGWSTVLADDAR